jgi:segregation and condensation protein B
MEAQATTSPAPRSIAVQQQLCEAALYVSGRPLDLKTIGSIIGARSEDKIRSVAQAVAEQYRGVGSPIQVLELPDGRFVMQLKGEFARQVKKLANRPLLTPGPLRTLSFIALRQPILQSRVVLVRGKLAYGHVKQLKEMDLVAYDKMGQSKLLRTTATFADYFNLPHDVSVMKKELKNVLDLSGEGQGKGEQAEEAGNPDTTSG